MPLLLSKAISSRSSYAVWNITETEDQLLERIAETPPLASPKRRSEWIVTRILAHYLCDSHDLHYNGVANLDSGKPVLKAANGEISITHSFPLAAALINLDQPCGIDLEWPRKQLARVAPKFLSDDEKKYNTDLQALCKVWTSKEVLIKIFGSKDLNLTKELKIEMDGDWRAQGHITRKDMRSHHQIAIEPVNQYILAYSC